MFASSTAPTFPHLDANARRTPPQSVNSRERTRPVRKIVPSRRFARGHVRSTPGLEQIEKRVRLADFPVTNTLDAGPGSLRTAIESANVTQGPDSISFNIGGGGGRAQPITQRRRRQQRPAHFGRQ